MFEEAVSGLPAGKAFLGQPSYEEFFFLGPSAEVPAVCEALIERFEEERLEHYFEQHRHLGELTYYDYRGDLIHVPYVNLALAGVCNAYRFVATYAAMAEWGAQVLLKARAQGSCASVFEE